MVQRWVGFTLTNPWFPGGTVYARLLQLWEKVSTGFWIVPVLMILGSIALAFLTLELDDRKVLEDLGRHELIYRGGPEGARAMLQTIAGSMITIAGVVFSITIVVLSLASNQMGPRLIRNFVHDGINQVALGTFTSTFVFCSLILLNVRGEEDEQFVPHLSVTIGLLLALASIVLLIFFIHHIAKQIQIPLIMATVRDELDESLDRILPIPKDPPTPQDRLRAVAALPKDFEHGGRPVHSKKEGYMALSVIHPLVELAEKHDLLLKVVRHPGEFIIQGSEMARVWAKGELPEEIDALVTGKFSFESTRSPVQDLSFSFNQLVEIGVRALSPSTNDPFSAMNCLDLIAAGLSDLARRPPPFPYFYDAKGRLRIVDSQPDFKRITEICLTPFRTYGSSSLTLMLHFFSVLEKMAPAIPREAERDVLLGHARRTLQSTLEHTTIEEDRRLLEEAFAAARTALERVGMRADR
jgi:uncharacterized membrane protein